MKVALVYDRVNKWGGAERVLLALHKIWPTAPVFTAVYDAKRARWADVFEVHSSFLNIVPFAKYSHELFPWLTPMAFESFNFDAYDVVISVTSAEAKNIITKTHTVHICYCLTPTRYLWSGFEGYKKNPGLGQMSGIAKTILGYMAPTLRKWDLIAASRPDYYIAISDSVKQRIQQYYHRDVGEVIYPPVDVDAFETRISEVKNKNKDGYFLTVCRLVGYKRVDLLIDAFNRLGWPLVIVGDGRDKARLKKRAKENIRFIDQATEKELVGYYEGCEAFVHAGEEDFGIAAVEAQAAGKPVIAYQKGGMGEIVIPGKTGILFEKQTEEALVRALQQFKQEWYDSASCRKNAQRFASGVFAQKMKDTVETVYNKQRI